MMAEKFLNVANTNLGSADGTASTDTKIGTIKRFAWPLPQEWHTNSWSIPILREKFNTPSENSKKCTPKYILTFLLVLFGGHASKQSLLLPSSELKDHSWQGTGNHMGFRSNLGQPCENILFTVLVLQTTIFFQLKERFWARNDIQPLLNSSKTPFLTWNQQEWKKVPQCTRQCTGQPSYSGAGLSSTPSVMQGTHESVSSRPTLG